MFFYYHSTAIAGFILFISLLFSKNNNPIDYLNEKTNKVFIIVTILMILSCIYNNFNNTIFLQKGVRVYLISLVNWIHSLCFWDFSLIFKIIRKEKQ